MGSGRDSARSATDGPVGGRLGVGELLFYSSPPVPWAPCFSPFWLAHPAGPWHPASSLQLLLAGPPPCILPCSLTNHFFSLLPAIPSHPCSLLNQCDCFGNYRSHTCASHTPQPSSKQKNKTTCKPPHHPHQPPVTGSSRLVSCAKNIS